MYDAALYTEEENARGVTSSIMLGQLAQVGTGGTRVFFPRPVRDQARQRVAPRWHALRSTCRSHALSTLPEVVEYVIDDVRPTAHASHTLSPPSETGRKRARFRPVSPPAKGGNGGR